MKNEVQGEGLPIKQLPSRTRQIIEHESQAIKMNFKQTVAGIISIGKSLQRIKSLLPRPIFLEHIRAEFQLSEMMAHRFISVSAKFAGSVHALSGKPSVLYLLAGAEDLSKVKRLAEGQAVLIGNKKMKLSELTVADAKKIRKESRQINSIEPTPKQIDKDRAATSFRELGNIANELQFWSEDLRRFKRSGLAVQNQKMLLETLKECRSALSDCIKALQ